MRRSNQSLALMLCAAVGCGSSYDSELGEPNDTTTTTTATDSTSETANTNCGNTIIEQGESCDGENLAGNDCTTLGFTSGKLACNPSCNDWDTSGCVEGQGALSGALSTVLGCEGGQDDDCQGQVFVLVLAEDPVLNPAQQPAAMAILPKVELSEGKVAEYSVSKVPEGTWFLTAFMDDDSNASTVAPGPDAGDPIAYPAVQIDILHEQTTKQDLVLNLKLP